MTKAAVTIRDVARDAGVSVATVSRVLNESGPVHALTAERVWAAARALRYMPNQAARSLITRQTRTLVVVLPDLHGEFFSEVIRGIDQRAQREHYHVLVSGSHDAWDEIAAALRAMHRRVDGVIIMSPDIEADVLKATLPPDLPAVLLNCVARGRDISAINIDNRGGAGEMVRHLVSLGRRGIGFIAGPARNHDAGERLAGYHEALARAELTAPLPALPGDFTEAGGYEAVRTLLEGAGGAGRVDALFAANDSMAVGALSALRRAGIKVPDDVAVVGFDDIPIAAYLSPPLTSMQVPIAELGVRAMEALLSAVQAPGAHEARQEVLPTRLVVRRSCGAPATAAADLGS